MALGGGIAAAALASSPIEAAATACLSPNPALEEGPFFVDEKLLRSDIRSGQPGTPLTLTINIQNQKSGVCAPLAGAYVDIWEANWDGKYSDKESEGTAGQNYLRGYQISDDNGQVTFTSLYPGWYAGRAVHIHLRVRTYSGSTVLDSFETQTFFDDSVTDTVFADAPYNTRGSRDTLNANDRVYASSTSSSLNVWSLKKTSAGYEGTLNLGVSLKTPPVAGPVITDDIKNAANGAIGVSPGTWTSIYGIHLAASTRLFSNSDIVNGALPTSLGGVSVKVNGKAAFVFYVSPTQINILSPSDTSLGSVGVTVTNSSGESALLAKLQPALPGLFTLSNYVRAVRPSDSVIVNGTGAPEGEYNSVAAARPGDDIELFGTGFGPVVNQPAAGSIFNGAFETVNKVTVTLDGISVPVLFAGLVGAGLYQINITVPSGLSAGDHVVVASVAGVQSLPTALLKTAS